MTLRSSDRKFSFDILGSKKYDDVLSSISRSSSDPLHNHNNNTNKSRRKKRNKKNKAGSKSTDLSDNNCTIVNDDSINYSSTMTTVTETCTIVEEKGSESENCEVVSRPVQFGELRQRNVSNTVLNELVIEDTIKDKGTTSDVAEDKIINNRDTERGSDRIMNNRDRERSSDRIMNNRDRERSSDRIIKNQDRERSSDRIANGNGRKVDEHVDWNKVMAVGDHKNTLSVVKSPMKCFMEEMYAGNSLRSTTTVGNDKERERVYDTIFRLPWRCELLIDVGFFVCLDSFLSLLTIMPTRIIIVCWRLLKTRQLKRLSSAELADLGSFIALIAGVTLLQQANISLIYHMIRGQGTIKLYVVYNVLEIFDKLCQSFGGDIMSALFHSADELANCSPENMQFRMWRFISDEALAVASSIVHSFILLAQAITLSTCIVAHNNALFAMLVSNNFSEIKGNVFKRFSKDNVQSLVYFDSIERFHISAFILFVLAQNMRESEGPWFESFLCNAMVVFMCEGMIDIIKHSFIAKFNDIKPIAYSEFLEDLCKQVLNIQTENSKKHLTFLPLAPACVVIRVFRPVFATHLPHNPLLWRLFWICILFLMTFVLLASLKLLIGTALRKHAQWYVKRCEKRKFHSD